MKSLPLIAAAIILALTTGCERDHSADTPISILGYTLGSPQREDNIKKLHIPRISYVPDKVQSPSGVILEPKEIKPAIVFTVSLSICHN